MIQETINNYLAFIRSYIKNCLIFKDQILTFDSH